MRITVTNEVQEEVHFEIEVSLELFNDVLAMLATGVIGEEAFDLSYREICDIFKRLNEEDQSNRLMDPTGDSLPWELFPYDFSDLQGAIEAHDMFLSDREAHEIQVSNFWKLLPYTRSSSSIH